MNLIAFVIPVHNRLSYTQECLSIVEKQNNSSFFTNNKVFTIVVDDGSSDNTSEYIRLKHPEVIVLQGNGDLWWSGSMNMAVKHALSELKCDFILLWENDIEPFPGYFDILQDHLNNWSDKQIICSKIMYKSDPNTVFAMGGIFDFRTGFKELIGHSKPDSEEYKQLKEVDWFCGQGILIHKSVFADIGYFDEVVFPQYHGDSDFALRAKKAGYKNLVFPNLKIVNDTATTGIDHIKNKTLKQLIKTLFSMRSNTNIIKDIKFYNRHATSVMAYGALFIKYSRYIGGFFKWKTLNLAGIKKKYNEFY